MQVEREQEQDPVTLAKAVLDYTGALKKMGEYASPVSTSRLISLFMPSLGPISLEWHNH